MKQKQITIEDVRRARQVLIDRGEQSGPRPILRQLGTGSLATISKHLRTIEAESPAPSESPGMIEAFRKVWDEAVHAGHDQAKVKIQELLETQAGLIEEAERTQAELENALKRIEEAERSQSTLSAELQKALGQTAEARGNAENLAQRHADALERLERIQGDHAAQIDSLRSRFEKELSSSEEKRESLRTQLEAARQTAHQLELKLARAEAKLESLALPQKNRPS